MKQSLCLHGVDFKHQSQFFAYVRQLLKPGSIKYKVKEKLFGHDDMYKYRQARLELSDNHGIKVSCIFGVLIVSDRVYPLADVIMEFNGRDLESAGSVKTLVRRFLAGKQRFILEDPDLEQRIAQLRGQYYLEELDAYDRSTAATALYCHLPWQVFAINKLWQEVLGCQDKTVLRQLRVKLRRLRSVLSLLRPLLPEARAEHWKQLLKQRAGDLSLIREYDVALLICARIRMFRKQEELSCLEQLLLAERNQSAQHLVKDLKLNRLTGELACFLLDIYSLKPASEYSKLSLKEFFVQRFDNWQTKILALPEKYPDFQNMEQLHKIRIKVKRFRYALQCVPELKASNALLRSLKALQDSLGLLHDDYINDCMVAGILAQQPDNELLHYEGAVFSGWEQGRADAAMEGLACQWETFSQQLKEWADDNL